MLDDTDLDIQEEPKSEPPRRGNRFVVIAGTLGAIMLLSLVAIVIYALVILPEQEPSEPGLSAAQQTGTTLAQVAQVSNTATTTRTATATTAPTNTNTPLATNTPLVTSTPDPATATVNALLTQAALAQTQAVTATGGPSPTPGTPTATPTALPNSGFADDIGALGLIGAAGALLVVVILARRLRNAA
jgi:cytoskeletal protein RodZ